MIQLTIFTHERIFHNRIAFAIYCLLGLLSLAILTYIFAPEALNGLSNRAALSQTDLNSSSSLTAVLLDPLSIAMAIESATVSRSILFSVLTSTLLGYLLFCLFVIAATFMVHWVFWGSLGGLVGFMFLLSWSEVTDSAELISVAVLVALVLLAGYLLVVVRRSSFAGQVLKGALRAVLFFPALLVLVPLFAMAVLAIWSLAGVILFGLAERFNPDAGWNVIFALVVTLLAVSCYWNHQMVLGVLQYVVTGCVSGYFLSVQWQGDAMIEEVKGKEAGDTKDADGRDKDTRDNGSQKNSASKDISQKSYNPWNSSAGLDKVTSFDGKPGNHSAYYRAVTNTASSIGGRMSSAASSASGSLGLANKSLLGSSQQPKPKDLFSSPSTSTSPSTPSSGSSLLRMPWSSGKAPAGSASCDFAYSDADAGSLYSNVTVQAALHKALRYGLGSISLVSFLATLLSPIQWLYNRTAPRVSASSPSFTSPSTPPFHAASQNRTSTDMHSTGTRELSVEIAEKDQHRGFLVRFIAGVVRLFEPLLRNANDLLYFDLSLWGKSVRRAGHDSWLTFTSKGCPAVLADCSEGWIASAMIVQLCLLVGLFAWALSFGAIAGGSSAGHSVVVLVSLMSSVAVALVVGLTLSRVMASAVAAMLMSYANQREVFRRKNLRLTVKLNQSCTGEF